MLCFDVDIDYITYLTLTHALIRFYLSYEKIYENIQGFFDIAEVILYVYSRLWIYGRVVYGPTSV